MSAKVDQVNFRVGRRDTSLYTRVTGLPKVRTRKLFSRFTATSRTDLSGTGTRERHFGDFITVLRTEKVGVPVGRVGGSTKVVGFSRCFSVYHVKVVLCKLCPSTRIGGDLLSVGPYLR